MQRTRILVATPRDGLRDSLRRLCQTQTDLEIAGETTELVPTMRWLEQQTPDVVVLTPDLVTCLAARTTRVLGSIRPSARFVLVNAQVLDSDVVTAADEAALLGVIRAPDGWRALRRERGVQPRAVVLGLQGPHWRGKGRPASTLSEREIQVLWLWSEYYTFQQIADALCLGQQTLPRYFARLKRKLGLHSTEAANLCALELGLRQTY